MSDNNMNTGKHKIVSSRNNTYFNDHKMMEGPSIPTEGTYMVGDIMINNGPTSKEEPMWICNESGTPGKWGPVSNTNTTIVPTYADMFNQKTTVGSLFYVISDESEDQNPGFFIVTSITEDENGNKIPLTVDKINKKERNIPSLTYDVTMPEGTKLYLKENEDLILKFNFSSSTYGDGKYRVYRDGILMRSWSAAKGNIIVNLGQINNEGSYEITVTATDYLTIPAPETLSFKVIVGGLKLSSTFDETLLTAIYEEGDVVEFPYSATVADTSATMKLKVSLYNTDTGEFVASENIELVGASVSSTWTSPPITKRGRYTLEAQAYTGKNANDTSDGAFTSNTLKYDFRVLKENEIGIMCELKTDQIDNNTYLSVPFKVTSKIANYFVVKGTISKDNLGKWEVVNATSDTGITTAVNITNYWSVGKLTVGTYKIELKAYTVDGGIESLESAIVYLTVVESTYQRVQPIKANLIAWFDANDMRNNDENPDIWCNSGGLEDNYRILLHNLNFSSNGWKHIDPSLSDTDDGEMMLKFTGDSYGEMVKMVNGIPTPYNPFSIFSNSGQQGLTIETAIRTRNVGVLKTRVLTCMNGDELDTPGVAITYDTLALGTDSQVNTMEFNEDEWVHVAFVIDNNIRNLNDVGQEMIEDLNQTKSIRIYINGVLCSCSVVRMDKYLDASGGSFPLMLNACKIFDAAGNSRIENYGECEIKFLRVYNSYLKSSEVLNNYIAHIYEQEDQIRASERNNVGIASLPTIVFRRNLTSTNQATFGILNSITDKKMSKKTCVDCVMEFNDGNGNIVVYDNVDVYLQGTSSLQYPVKNYKIKAFNDAGRLSKNKFVPPVKEDEWTPDNTYTLKCDYMEQSHKNNTPTARFFNQIVEKLGGESPAKKDGYHDAIDGFPCIVYYNDDGGENVLVGSFMFNIDKEGKELGFECDLYDESGNVVGSGKDSCVSYEGTANASDTAGCFYKLEDSIESVYRYYIEDSYKDYLTERGLTEADYPIDRFRAAILSGELDYLTFDEFVEDYDEIDYIMADFEARYTFNEDDDRATYKPMVDLVNWVSDSIEAGTFKKDLEAHLDLKYMLSYYLQMQVFTQVDNCGKNAMWDTWDGVKFYPRPYDMDTSMGLSNTGTETIRVDAEILPELSPIEIEGTYAGYEYTDITTDLRYLSFNTKTSKLWNAFAAEFADEIKDAYKVLRNAGIFTVGNIFKNAQSITDDMIGEVYFNKDAGSKYLSQTTESTSEYLKMLHGNRVQKYKKFLKERIIFLDTIYDYMESDVQIDSINSIITLRSDVLYGQSATETMKCYLGISVYSPQYVTISVGSGQDAIVTAYVGPESTYVDPDTNMECEGTLFSFPIRGTDKEMTISGAGNIKDIAKIQGLNVRDLIITKAERILNLDLSYSSRMTALTLGNNRYLRTLNCANSYLLGTATNGQSIDLTKCINLKEINLAYTKLTAVAFPTDNVITSINLKGSSIKNIEIDGAEFLNNINIEDCDNINKFQLNRCNKITEVNVANSTIQNFIVTNCDNVTSVDVSGCKSISRFDVTNSYNIESLNFKGNTSIIMNDLQLYSMYNLKSLNVSQTTSLHTIRLPKYLNETEAFKASNGEPALPWEQLETLNLSSSSIVKIQYGSADVSLDAVDMTQLKNLTSFNIQQCTSLKEVKNIQYRGALANLFSGCSGLTKITGTLTNSNNSIASMFSGCKALSNIDGLTFNFTNVANANSTCYQCANFRLNMVKKILQACGSSLTSATNMCNMYGAGSGVFGTGSDATLPANLFEHNPNLSNISGMFGYTKIATVPGNLLDPMASKITNVGSLFNHNTTLKTVGSGLLKYKPNLTTIGSIFWGCTNLTNYIDVDPNIFEGSPNITSTSGIFYNCHNLATGELGLGEMLYPLVNLTNTSYMFYQCYNNFVAEIPNGFLSKNPRLTNISGMFQRCRKIPTLPRSLFRVNPGDTNTFPYLVTAISVFADCRAMEGIVDSTFFVGAEKITDIGKTSNNTNYASEGFFYNTKISGYHETFLHVLPALRDTSDLFRACKSLSECHYYNERSEDVVRQNTISNVLLQNNPMLTNVSGMFQDCTLLEGVVPANLFEPCAGTLTNASNMFYGCTGLTGVDLDDIENGKSGIHPWFKNVPNLTNVSGFLRGVTSYTGSVPGDLFEGCRVLSNVSSFFYGCADIEGGVPITLFNDCRSTLSDTSYMFYGCNKLSNPLPSGEYEIIQGVTGYKLSTAGTEGALQVVGTMLDPFTQVPYADVINLSPNLATIINPSGSYYVVPEVGDIVKILNLGLLSECVNLTSVASMFSGCYRITGGIPEDLFFTSKSTMRYSKLTNVSGLFSDCWAMNKGYVEEESGIIYLCNPNLLDKCPAITNMSATFHRLSAMPRCEIHPLMFEKQSKLENISSVFNKTPVTGTITNLFRNSVGTIVNATAAFAHTKITGVGATFLNNGGVNKKLKNVRGIFVGCGSTLYGTSPEFWNGAKFTAIEMTQSGYWGALNGCTNLTNYEAANAVSPNWVVYQEV